MKQHAKLVHEGTTFNCHKCEKVFTCNSNLRVHLEWHDLKENGLTIICKKCNKKFSGRIYFNNHVKRIHKGLVIEPEMVLNEISNTNQA